MNARIKQRIEDARIEVRAADDVPDKEGLLDQLAAADEAINGTPDKIAALSELVALRTAAEAVQAVRLPAVVKTVADAAVAGHVANCPGKTPPDPKPGTWPWYVDKALRSWPLAAAIVALAIFPNGARILDAVAGLIKR
jgi:hypothetical protein